MNAIRTTRARALMLAMDNLQRFVDFDTVVINATRTIEDTTIQLCLNSFTSTVTYTTCMVEQWIRRVVDMIMSTVRNTAVSIRFERVDGIWYVNTISALAV